MDAEKLKKAGVNYDEGLGRFAGKVPLYEKYILKFLDDPSFSQLREAMERQDYEAAFQCAHTLKGVSGNLSFNVFYRHLSEFVELLRGGADIQAARAAFPALEREMARLLEQIREAV
jgi:HPt (histidine-containing phosphotransfer) domain-containing protein